MFYQKKITRLPKWGQVSQSFISLPAAMELSHTFEIKALHVKMVVGWVDLTCAAHDDEGLRLPPD